MYSEIKYKHKILILLDKNELNDIGNSIVISFAQETLKPQVHLRCLEEYFGYAWIHGLFEIKNTNLKLVNLLKDIWSSNDNGDVTSAKITAMAVNAEKPDNDNEVNIWKYTPSDLLLF